MYQTQQSHQQKNPDFLSKENLKDLFETLVENEFSDFTQIMKSQDTELINNTFQLFCKKAVDFYRNHLQLLDNEDKLLLELNKKFIIYMLRNDKKPDRNLFVKQQQIQPIQQQTVFDYQHKDFVIEETQKKQRQKDFYEQLENKKSEFMSSVVIKKPDPPNFGDTVIDRPIKNISVLLNSMMEDRNKELEEIQKLYPMKIQEKQQQPHHDSNYIDTEQQTQIKKYITIDTNDSENQLSIIGNDIIILDELDSDSLTIINNVNVNVNNNNNKKVSWEDEIIPEIIVEFPIPTQIIPNNDDGFLEKLKIITVPDIELNEQLFSLFNNRFECLEDKINKIFELLTTQQKKI